MELTREPTGLPLLLLLRGIVTEQTVCPIPGKDISHQAVIVREDVSAERWQAIVKLIRTKYRYQQFPLYEKTARGWKTVR
jgi:hypothetical protein